MQFHYNAEAAVYHIKDETTHHYSMCGRLVTWMATSNDAPEDKRLCKQCESRMADGSSKEHSRW